MQWSNIKTLFILCFLILDIYLLVIFIGKQDQIEYDVLDDQQASLEDQLKAEGITYGDIPERDWKGHYISVRPRDISDDELEKLQKNDDQESAVIKDNFIVSTFDRPIPLKDSPSHETLKAKLSGRILYFGEYMYWGWNKDLNVLVLFQKKDDLPVYFNQNSLLLIYLNDENEITFYTQTMLGEAKPEEEAIPLINPLKAIETLYFDNTFSTGDTITNMEMGYHTRVPLENGVQVFAPTWKVTVNDDHNYFVNAVEGLVFSSSEQQFIQDTLQSTLDKVGLLSSDDLTRDDIMRHILERLPDDYKERDEDRSAF